MLFEKPSIIDVKSLMLTVFGLKQKGKCPKCDSGIVGSRGIFWCSSNACGWTSIPEARDYINEMKELNGEDKTIFL